MMGPSGKPPKRVRFLLKGAPSAFDCEVEEIIDRATHSIVIGRVRAIRETDNAGALIYWNCGFQSLNA